jgi:predicted lipid-binding transport protein (Tim44 family)
MSDIYDMNVLERKLKGLSRLKKRVFNVDDNGNIWDPATGEIFGNVNTLKETPATPKTQPKADFDFEHTASELIVKHYGEEDVNAIAGAVNKDLMEKYDYITSIEEDEQIIDMINEYTANQR